MAGLNPTIEVDYSVSVPVLSNTKVFTYAPRLTRIGEMQKMFYRLSRRIAKYVPAVRAAGKAGGTVYVNMSRVQIIINLMLSSSFAATMGTTMRLAKIAMMIPRMMNFSDSCSNLKWRSVGYRISRMMLPLAVR